LDSSVLVSAFLTPPGAPGQVLDAAEAGVFTLCLSREILVETAKALLRAPRLRARYGFDRAAVERFCDGLAASAEMVADLPALQAVPRDPKDDPIVATAVAGRADYLVTGDRRHLLPLGSYRGIQIVSVRAFLELLAEP
jgi:putative PIN family toxin of toxin-antitoxin system